MKKVISKRKVGICLSDDILGHLNKFENKSKYIEYLIYKDLKENGVLEKEIIL